MKISGAGRNVSVGELHRGPEESQDLLDARLDAAEPVVVAVVPGGVGVEHRGEPVRVARGDGVEAPADGGDLGGGSGGGGGVGGHDRLLQRVGRRGPQRYELGSRPGIDRSIDLCV
jgi:hypothetical protein